MLPTLTSVQNTSVKRWASLQTSKGRKQHRQTLAEGEKACTLALQARLAIEALLISEATGDEAAFPAVSEALLAAYQQHPSPPPWQPVSSAVFQKIATTQTPPPIMAIVSTQGWVQQGKVNSLPLQPLLVLDGLQDPGNVGTLYRLAKAFGVSHVVGIPPWQDVTHPKVIRSHTGLGFGLHTLISDEDTAQTLARLHQAGWQVLLATAEAATPYTQLTLNPHQPWALVLGQEGGGLRLSAEARRHPELQHCQGVSVPMCDEAESLNVATCGAILLSHLLQQGVHQESGRQ